MTSPTNAPLSRRTVARGAAWAAPAVLLASSAPAAVASPTTPTGCGTLVWTNTTLSGTQGTSATRTGVITLADGSQVTVTVAQQRTGGQPGRKIDSGQPAPTATYGDFSATAAGGQQAWANGVTSNQQNLYVVNGGTSSVLTLNQGTSTSGNGTTRGSETLTFSFTDASGAALTPQSIFFNAYDITSQQTNMNNAAYYTDSLSFAGATLTTSGATGVPSVYNITSTSISSYGTNTSTSTGNYIGLTLTPTSSTVNMTYSNTSTTPLVASSNYQYVGIGDMTVCF